MFYSFLADAIVALHVAYVSFVVLGQLAIWIGLLLRWRWVRNPWFRWIHLVMICLVGIEAAFDITCPLTTLENGLRRLGGAELSEGSFMGRLLHALIFFRAPEWVLASLHITFALVVLATFVLAPPRPWRDRARKDPSPQPGPGGRAAHPRKQNARGEETSPT